MSKSINDLISFPVKFLEGSNGIIIDAKGSHVCDIRMWGELESKYCMHAAVLQDQISIFIAKAINEQFDREDIV